MYRSKDNKVARIGKDRYMQSSLGSEQPSVLNSQETLPNKENIKNAFNRSSIGVSTFKSMELSKGGKLGGEECQEGLRSSREFINYRKKGKKERHETCNMGEFMTFGEVKGRQQMTSRDFGEERRLKGEVLDEMMLDTSKRMFSKSWHPPVLSPRSSPCVNHPDKKAKYRLLSELSEGEQEMFYCSKCAINLAQRGFKIEQIKEDESHTEAALHRMQQISKFELSLRSLEERARVELDKIEITEGIEALEEEIISTSQHYDLIIDAAQKMKNKRVNLLKEQYRKKENEQEGRRSKLNELFNNLVDIQKEMTEYRASGEFDSFDEDHFQFLTSTLQNKISAYQDTLISQCHAFPAHSRIKTMTSSEALDSVKKELMKPRARLTTFQLQSSRRARTESEQAEDSFACDEAKMPFRELFPPSEEGPRTSTMLSSVREQPTFSRYCDY